MEVTQKEVLLTAELLNIDVGEDEIETLTNSFSKLIEYFDVLNNVPLDIEGEVVGDDISRIRDGEAEERTNTEELIENSEEHEDNYVVIPNVL